MALIRAPGGEASSSGTPDAAVTTSAEKKASPNATPSTSAARRPVSGANTATRATTTTRPATSAKSVARTAPKPAAAPQTAYSSREQERRIARAKEMRRVRQANVVTPEHYRYVMRDLRLTGILAGAMFAVIVVLHFVLS